MVIAKEYLACAVKCIQIFTLTSAVDGGGGAGGGAVIVFIIKFIPIKTNPATADGAYKSMIIIMSRGGQLATLNKLRHRRL